MYLHSMIFTAVYLLCSAMFFYAHISGLSKAERTQLLKNGVPWGCVGYVASLIHTFAASRLVYYCKSIKDDALLRALVEAGCMM